MWFMWLIDKIGAFLIDTFLGSIWLGLDKVGDSPFIQWLLGIGWEVVAVVVFFLVLLFVIIYFVLRPEFKKRSSIKRDLIKRNEVDTVIYMTSIKCLDQAIKGLEKNEVSRLHDNAREIISHNFLRGLTYNLSLPDDFVNRLKRFLNLIEVSKNELRSTSSIKFEIKLSSTGECIEERDLYCLVEDLKKDVQTLEKNFAEKIKTFI